MLFALVQEAAFGTLHASRLDHLKAHKFATKYF